MKKTVLHYMIISLLVITFLNVTSCNKDNEEEATFVFPLIESMDLQVYEEIKQTCETYWDLNNMIDSTFEIIDDNDEFSVHCDGISDGQLYHFVIRTDNDGKWINDTRSIVQTSDEFIDITFMVSYNDFENIKNFILSNGDRETYCNMYLDNPHYSFGEIETYLHPETGQLNINCDPELSDFNQIVIRDHNSSPQYFHIMIVRDGDLNNEQITGKKPGMVEGKIYLLKYYDYDLKNMADKVHSYIDEIMDTVE